MFFFPLVIELLLLLLLCLAADLYLRNLIIGRDTSTESVLSIDDDSRSPIAQRPIRNVDTRKPIRTDEKNRTEIRRPRYVRGRITDRVIVRARPPHSRFRVRETRYSPDDPGVKKRADFGRIHARVYGGSAVNVQVHYKFK